MSEETTAKVEAAEEEQVNLAEDLKFGYLVGVKGDGSFVFQILGEEKGVVQLMGINQFARRQLEVISDANMNQGEPLLANGINAIGQELVRLRQAVTQLLPKPEAETPEDNE